MSTAPELSFASAAARVLDQHEFAPEAVAALAELAEARTPALEWCERLELPIEREVEMLARALLDRFEGGEAESPLEVMLHVTRWRERPDGCELGLGSERESARWASPLLARVVCAPPEGADALVQELALACAAALLRGALERIDPELVLGEAGALEVEVAFPDGPRRSLGPYDGAWEALPEVWEAPA